MTQTVKTPSYVGSSHFTHMRTLLIIGIQDFVGLDTSKVSYSRVPYDSELDTGSRLAACKLIAELLFLLSIYMKTIQPPMC